MANALLDVIDTFTSLDANYDVLMVACQTQTDRDALKAKYAAAQANVETCTGKALEDDDAEVAELSKDLKICNDEIKIAETEMGDMSKVLDNLTQALTIGAQLIAKLP
jgi:hypothetical protein